MENFQQYHDKFLTQSNIAKIFNKDRQRINTLLKTGKLNLNENKKISFNEAYLYFKNEDDLKIKKEQEKENKKNSSIDDDANYNQVLTYKLKIEARTKELDLKEREKKLIDKESIIVAINTIGSKLKESLIALPNRISPVLAIENEERVINEILNKEIRITLDSIIQELKSLEQKNEF